MRRSPAYARDVVTRRNQGERIGLLVVAIHDWKAGRWFQGRPEVARVVVTEDQKPDQMRFDCAHALDVVLCGSCTAQELQAVASAVSLWEPASLWGEFEAGICRIDRVGKASWYAVGEPVAVRDLARAVRNYREAALAAGEGIYGSGVFLGARKAALQSLLGAGADDLAALLGEGA